MGIRQYFSGTLQKCVTGIAMMAKDASNRIIPLKSDAFGNLTETYKKTQVIFTTNALPADGIITNQRAISTYADTGAAGIRIAFTDCGDQGVIFGGKLYLNNITAIQNFRLYIFTNDGVNNFNNGNVYMADTQNNGFLGYVNYSTIVATAGVNGSSTIYEATLTNPLSFQGIRGNLYGILVNNNGSNITIAPNTSIKIDLSILSK